MNTRLALAVAASLIALPAFADEAYVLDPVHSQPRFTTRHMGLTTQVGSFVKSSAKAMIDWSAKKGTVDVTIDTASVRTHDASRLDALVKGEKYLNVEKYPTITFTSHDIRFSGDTVVGVDGELTMLGVTKPVSFKVDGFKCGPNPFNKKPMCGGEASTVIKRSEFGMTAGLPLAPADEVIVTVPIEAYLTLP